MDRPTNNKITKPNKDLMNPNSVVYKNEVYENLGINLFKTIKKKL